MKQDKNFFKFGFFNDLVIGNVFKFSPVIDNDIPSKFYRVYKIQDGKTLFNSTYGKSILRLELNTDLPKEVMIFTNR